MQCVRAAVESCLRVCLSWYFGVACAGDIFLASLCRPRDQHRYANSCRKHNRHSPTRCVPPSFFLFFFFLALKGSTGSFAYLKTTRPVGLTFPAAPGILSTVRGRASHCLGRSPGHLCCEPLVAGTTTWSRKLERESVVLSRVFQYRYMLKLVHERRLHVLYVLSVH